MTGSRLLQFRGVGLRYAGVIYLGGRQVQTGVMAGRMAEGFVINAEVVDIRVAYRYSAVIKLQACSLGIDFYMYISSSILVYG